MSALWIFVALGYLLLYAFAFMHPFVSTELQLDQLGQFQRESLGEFLVDKIGEVSGMEVSLFSCLVRLVA
jgi:hypothetical protein